MELAIDRGDTNSPRRGTNHPGPTPPRWRLKERNKQMLQAAAIVSAWSWDAQCTSATSSIDEEAEDLRKYMNAACNASMPRSNPSSGHLNKGVYWWTPEIAELRESCNRARRRFAQAQRRRQTRDEEEISHTYEKYREARRTLQREIKMAKARSWTELVDAVESDPWGRPYKVVTHKLRTSAPPITTNMDPMLLDKVVGTLFPRQDDGAGQPETSLPSTTPNDNDEVATTTTEWSEELHVTEEELLEATKRTAARDVAPGPDGIPGRVWAETVNIMAPRLRHYLIDA
ncbi:uncharacterized protein LOC132915727 [Bombus pascuorum]|uniref:uncharacterized protein LOC132915727 n=1 Tax=Bombus pascuorum TaxID=65598 RepID=UPI00298EC2FE|nr:uncharacterized protein LOC132915727 [Bombus pascuorum]